MQIRMYNINGNWMAGKSDGKKITDPRLYFFDTKQHAFLSMPGNPDEVPIPDGTFYYALPDGDVKDLYLKQLSNIEVVGAGEMPKGLNDGRPSY
jgi:hypothetical protein